jgi:hypothetical protein
MSFFVVELFAFRTTTEFFTQKQIPDPSAFQSTLKLVMVEVRHVPRVRVGPDINEYLNSVGSEKPNERLQPVVGMAYREKTSPIFNAGFVHSF